MSLFWPDGSPHLPFFVLLAPFLSLTHIPHIRENVVLTIAEVQTLIRALDEVRSSQVPQIQAYLLSSSVCRPASLMHCSSSAVKLMQSKGFDIRHASLLFSQMLAQAATL